MNDGHHLCPVCRRTVTRTKQHNICGHYDKAHEICPASYRSFDITITETPPKDAA